MKHPVPIPLFIPYGVKYRQAIAAVQHAARGYDPTMLGYAWDEENPRIQLEPRGERGYIELYPVRPCAE